MKTLKKILLHINASRQRLCQTRINISITTAYLTKDFHTHNIFYRQFTVPTHPKQLLRQDKSAIPYYINKTQGNTELKRKRSLYHTAHPP